MPRTAYLGSLLFFFLLVSCAEDQKKTLPILGRTEVVQGDTQYHTLPDFQFINQNGKELSKQDLLGQVFVADFFFVSCPTICPIMSKNLKKVYERFEDAENFTIVSHTIDTKHDSVPVLKSYSEMLGVQAPRWHFVTGNQDSIYQIGYDFYMASIQEDDSPGSGGYLHSGGLILVDRKGRIRGIYDGTKDAAVGQLISDLKILL